MWGYLAKVVVPTPKKVKIGPKTVDCIFIGYAQNSSAYRFLVYKSEIPDIHRNTIMESRNTSFFEHIFPYKGPSSSMRTYETMNKDSQDQDQEQKVEDELRRSKRIRIEKSFGLDFLTYLLENEPQSFQEAMNSLEGPLWKDTIKSEIDSIL